MNQNELATVQTGETLIKEHLKKVDLLKTEDSKIKQGYKDLKIQQDEMALNHGGAKVDSNDVLEINAGGKLITVTRRTLTQLKGTVLAALFSGRWENKLQKDGKGHIFLDVNPSCFQSIIDYLNELKISPPDNPPDPPAVEQEDEVFLERLMNMFGMDEIYHPALDTTTLVDSCHEKALCDFLLEDDIRGELKLLYRGSRDGFGASDFHAKCDNKGATVTVIKDVGGYLFGGFVDKPWNSDSRTTSSEKAFLFSMHCFSGLEPTKFRLKTKDDANAMTNEPSYGPTFGGNHDIHVANQANANSQSYTHLGETFECPEVPEQTNATILTGNYHFRIAEVEVFCLPQYSNPKTAKKRKRDNSNSHSQHETEPWEIITFDDESMKIALKTDQEMLTKANEDLRKQIHAFQKEKEFIKFFVMGDTNDIITLNVSGEIMSIKKATLSLYKESAFAKQFNDPVWMKGATDASELVKKWNPNEVATWISSIGGLSEDTAKTLIDNEMNGAELLSLNFETLKFFGITRPATLALVTEEIKELRKGDHSRGVLIEQSPYCFGKILDQLRLRAMCNAVQDSPPLPPPIIGKPYQKRFKRIVEYYFPNDAAAFE